MAPDGKESEFATLSPEEAFSALGEETRLEILLALGEADEPLAFSDLRDRVGYDTAGNFSYHLDELSGHFIRKREDSYGLRPPGRRVLEAVLSGAVTEVPKLGPVQIDRPCPYCGGPVEVSYREERLEGYCTECLGVYKASGTAEGAPDGKEGLLGFLPLPPAGIRERSLEEAETAAWTWGTRDMIAISNGVCPRCSGRLSQVEDYCLHHDVTDGLCSTCGNRHAVQIASRCNNCIFDHEGAFVLKLMANTELLAFVATHGLNPITDHWEFGWDYDEEIVLTDPFEARFTFTIAGDSLTLTVGDQLEVVESTTG